MSAVLARMSALVLAGGPQRNALVRRPQQRPVPRHDRSAEFINIIRERAGQMGKSSFLEIVPEQYRQAVIHMADTAYNKRGLTGDRAEFRELMALKWLAQREAFETLSREAGFRTVNFISSSQAEGVMGLSINGSLVGLSQPNGGGQRGILYGRIEDREDSKVPELSHGNLMLGASVGERLRTTIFSSSIVIALAANPRADIEEVQQSFIEMRRTLGTIGQTVFVPANSPRRGNRLPED